jgi:PAS domain S-box-containing protein
MPLSILVVEDHAKFRHFTCAALRRRAEFQTIEAADGLEAVRKAEEFQPQVILLDINLPKMNGFEVAKRLRTLAPRSRLLFMSQEFSADIVQEALGLGASGYIQKASASADLLCAIDAVLAGQRFVSRSLGLAEPAAARTAEAVQPERCWGEHMTDLGRAEAIRSQYAAIVESSDDAIIAKTLDGVISAWNAAAERMFGFTAHEAIGRPISIIIPPEVSGEEHDILRRLRAGERLERYETVRLTKSGARLDVSLTISPLRDAAGRIVGCSKIARDVTQATQAAAALRQSERRLAREVACAKTLQSISTRLMSESTPESLYAQILGAAMELMVSDCASVQMLDADQASLSLLASKNFHPESAAFWQRVEIGAGSTCGKALRDNERVVVGDIEACAFMGGTQDQLEYRRSGIRAVQSTPLRSRSGRPLGMLSTHWRAPHDPTEEDFRLFDVLARQAADLIERTLAEQAVREGEERFRVIANSAPVMIWMSDTEKQITYLNQTWLDYTGRPLDDAVGHGWIEALHTDEVERCRDVYVNAFDQREAFQIEHRLRRRGGEYGWVETVGVPRYTVDGSFGGYIGTAVDITQRKLAEEALSTVSQKLIEAHEEERTRIARELHDDISQRLALVCVRLGDLKQGSPASAADFPQEIDDVYRQIGDLASDIQALSHGLHPPKLELMGLEAAVTGFCEEVSHRHGVTVDVQCENIPKTLPPDISLCLYRVLQEALQNAVKHGGSRRALVSLNGHINTIDMTVTDSGAGFDPHDAMKGPGLGLTSMKERLKVVGGQLSIDSQRGRGTTIHAVAPVRLQMKAPRPVQ